MSSGKKPILGHLLTQHFFSFIFYFTSQCHHQKCPRNFVNSAFLNFHKFSVNSAFFIRVDDIILFYFSADSSKTWILKFLNFSPKLD